MKSGTALIDIFQKKRIKSLSGEGASEVRLKKKLDSFTLKPS